MNKKDPKNGYPKGVWGPSLWHVLNSMAFNYPARPTPQKKLEYWRFFKSLGAVLPCGECRSNYPSSFRVLLKSQNSPPLRSRATLIKYIHDVHKAISGAQRYPLSLQQLHRSMETLRSPCETRVVLRRQLTGDSFR